MLKIVFRIWYEVVGFLAYVRGTNRQFLNLGYGKPEDAGDVLASQRQLYQKLVQGVDISNRSVLEVGCGRGGGCRHLSISFSLKQMVGLDNSVMNLELSRQFNKGNRSEFIWGNASGFNLHRMFDVIINLESSHAYPSLIGFYQCVKRHLKPNGIFCYADLMLAEDFEEAEILLMESGFHVVSEEILNGGVAQSLITNARHWFPFSEKNPKLVPRLIHNINVTTHSDTFKLLEAKRIVYKRFILTHQPNNKSAE